MPENRRKFYYPEIEYNETYGSRVLTELSDLVNDVYEKDEIPYYLIQQLEDPNIRLLDALRNVAEKVNTDFTVLNVSESDFPESERVPRDLLSQIRGYAAGEVITNDCRLSSLVMAYTLQNVDFLQIGLRNYGYVNIDSPVHLSVVVNNLMKPKRNRDPEIIAVHFGVGSPFLRTYPNLEDLGGIVLPLNAKSVGILEKETSINYEPYLQRMESELPNLPASNIRKINAWKRLISLGR